VAVNVLAGDVMDLKGIWEELGNSVEDATIYQESTSTIHLLANEFIYSQRSKHIGIRGFLL